MLLTQYPVSLEETPWSGSTGDSQFRKSKEKQLFGCLMSKKNLFGCKWSCKSSCYACRNLFTLFNTAVLRLFDIGPKHISYCIMAAHK